MMVCSGKVKCTIKYCLRILSICAFTLKIFILKAKMPKLWHHQQKARKQRLLVKNCLTDLWPVMTQTGRIRDRGGGGVFYCSSWPLSCSFSVRVFNTQTGGAGMLWTHDSCCFVCHEPVVDIFRGQTFLPVYVRIFQGQTTGFIDVKSRKYSPISFPVSAVVESSSVTDWLRQSLWNYVTFVLQSLCLKSGLVKIHVYMFVLTN